MQNEAKIIYLISAAAVFVITAVILKFLIPVLASKKMGQKILDIGPRWHKNKEGTPTMGGISFIIASVAIGVAVGVYIALRHGFSAAAPFWVTLAMATLSGLVGIIDDRAKLHKKQNEGLTAAQKFLLQVAVAALYLVGLRFCGYTTELYIPFWGKSLELGFLYYPIALFLLCGIMNSVNLTDGIDGLASCVTLAVSLFFGACGAIIGNSTQLSAIAGLMTGAAAGFLVYNFYPARVFMGDTGSLFLGGLCVGAAFLMNNPLIIVVCGIVYIAETASVMLQVGYFKLTHGKRLFKMAPIHHHFEQCGWSEITIVSVFTLVTLLFCVVAYFGI